MESVHGVADGERCQFALLRLAVIRRLRELSRAITTVYRMAGA